MRFTSRPHKKQTAELAQETSLFSVWFLALKSNVDYCHLEDLLAPRSLRVTSRVPEPAGRGCVEAFAFRQIPRRCQCCWPGDPRWRTARTRRRPRPALSARPSLQTQIDSVQWNSVRQKAGCRLVTRLPLAPHWGWGEQKVSLLTVPTHTSALSLVSKDLSLRWSDINQHFYGFKVFSEIHLSNVSINGSFWSS